ncbi:toxin [Streptomyces buecherae]|uniref:toxin n=1 Tax=Streptomyces buecherae TaxID=2763006 RepID=UPI0036A1C0CA
MVNSMPMPVPFTVSGLVAGMEAARGRRIRLVRLEEGAPGPGGACGVWWRHREQPLDLILHVRGVTLSHRRKIVLHELCHLWCEDGADVGSADLARLLPGMDSGVAQGMLISGQVQARGGYDSFAEKRAELVADVLHDRVRAGRVAVDPLVQALGASLGRPGRVPARGEVQTGA